MSDVVAKLVAIVKAEVGYHEGKSASGHWNNKEKYAAQVPGLEWADYQPWCATFVSWAALKAGVDKLFPRTASCAAGVSWFKNKGRFSEYPAVGAQVFYGSGGGTHTGLVVAFDADYIYAVEGNTNDNGSAEGDGVYLKKRARRDAHVYGYGVPAFEGLISADPRWGGAKSGKVAAPVVTKPATPKPSHEPYPGAAFFKDGRKSPIIAAMHKRLVAVGCNHYASSRNTDVWGSGDEASYAAWQRKCGHSGSGADGIPGRATWDALKVPNV
jgi:hypothetical protein